MLTEWIVDAIRRSTTGFRLERMRRFRQLMSPDGDTRILDVGGSPEMWLGSGLQAASITLVNLDPPETSPSLPDGWHYVQADGRALPYADGSFDIVFSNSVIEHVGGWEDQEAFAREVRRVGKRYWVQTPNRHFPIEPHFNFPLLQFLPPPIADLVAIAWPFSFPKRHREGSIAELRAHLRATRLLTLRELEQLFPAATVWRERFAGLDKSFVVYRARDVGTTRSDDAAPSR